jgi:MoaA/NifB/PqqE/SkfB family radical SAM enzyme
MFDFANILFSGACNARCPFCIGKQVLPGLNQDNLHLFPPANLDRFIHLVWEHRIPQVVLTGTNTDPQLYAYEGELLALLRQRLPAGTQISLHTNGRLALRKIDWINQYDRVAISFPSFKPETYRRIMGVSNPPDLERIIPLLQIPFKISCILHPRSQAELGQFLQGCQERGVQRVVLRKIFGEKRSWEQLIPFNALGLESQGVYRGNPVYYLEGMEVTLWDFTQSACTSLNLFSNGQINADYLLAQPGSQEARSLHPKGPHPTAPPLRLPPAPP